MKCLGLKITFLKIPSVQQDANYTQGNISNYILQTCAHTYTNTNGIMNYCVLLSLQVIEKQCLQDLMYCAVHAPRKGSRSMFHSLRCVLACFHRHITQQNVITMLVRLYGPFLWRSLKVCCVYVCA